MIKIITNQDTQATQSVVITPDPITHPTRTVPLEQYVAQLTQQQTNLQAQLDKVTAQLQEVTDAGGDVATIQQKISQRATPNQIAK
jgi:hypothetical protein